MRVDRRPHPGRVGGGPRLAGWLSTNEALARLRWHWTLDESNPDRVSLREYARQVGRAYKTIAAMANGYAAHQSGGAAAATLNEAIERAKMGAERELATEAVAKARGITFAQARKTQPDKVREVLHTARDLAEERGIAVEEAAATAVRLAIRVCRRKSPPGRSRATAAGGRAARKTGEVSLLPRRGGGLPGQ